MSKYQEILLSKISTNPKNPRKSFEGPGFDELVASIRSKGVIEPIIVRPVSKGKAAVESDQYEVVAGERRFRASRLINEGQEKARIPAIIRELSDDDAFDFMIIENLQREDLTSYEEAVSLKQYCEKKGRGSIPDLAQRIGKTVGYIRRKISVLSLPDYILKAWEDETISFSHLEQLRRLKTKEDLKESFDYAIGRMSWGGQRDPASKRELKDHIDKMSPPLGLALFNIEKEGCVTCGQNSEVQKAEFEIEGMKGPHCLDKKCFKQKQNNFLQGHWKETDIHKKYKTAGFRFYDNVSYHEFESFDHYGKPAKKCSSCENFLTIVDSYGEVKTKRACFKPVCYSALGRKNTMDQIKTERQIRVESGGPRVTWHGEFFREEFLQKRLPEKYQEFEPCHIKIYRAALFAFLKSDSDVFQDIRKEFKLKDFYSGDELFKMIEKMELNKIMEIMKQFALKVIMKAWPVNQKSRLAIAGHIGINLLKEFAVTKEYLDKKTIGEIIEFGEKSGIFKDKKVADYLVSKLKKKPGQFDKCKKTELVELFLKSGVDLVGKVPDEIIPKEKK